MQDLSGQSIGRYEIIKRLGEGGMAVVYLAEDTALHRQVAIKMIRVGQIPPDQLPRVLERFRREAEALAQLSDDPGIVTVYDFGEHEGTPYLVMAYMPQGSLKDHLTKPLDYRTAARLLVPVAEALIEAHLVGIIHRDVKPSNLLINRKGGLALADFGIAKALELDGHTLTGTGMGVGTPEYMAPEQWKGDATPQSDIYALGVVFYEMITGQKPYGGSTPSDVFLKQMTETPRRPSELVPGLPLPVESLLAKSLARDPQRRFVSMLEMRDAFLKLAGSGESRAVYSDPRQRDGKQAAFPVLDTREETRDLLADMGDETRTAGSGAAGQALPDLQAVWNQPGQIHSSASPSGTMDELDMQETYDALSEGEDAPKRSKGWWKWLVPALVLVLLIGAVITLASGLFSVVSAYPETQTVPTSQAVQVKTNTAAPTRTSAAQSSASKPTATRQPAASTVKEEDVEGVVNSYRAILRIGPGENYRMLCYLDKGTRVKILGRNADGSWLLIEFLSGQSCYTLNTSGKKVTITIPAGQQVWVSSASLKVSGTLSGLKAFAAPPTETPIVVKAPAQSGDDGEEGDSGDQYP